MKEITKQLLINGYSKEDILRYYIDIITDYYNIEEFLTTPQNPMDLYYNNYGQTKLLDEKDKYITFELMEPYEMGDVYFAITYLCDFQEDSYVHDIILILGNFIKEIDLEREIRRLRDETKCI